MIGLGIGSAAHYVGPHDTAVFFELDPQVASLARNEKYFSYLSRCGDRCNVEIGDGRLLIAQKKTTFDLIFIDAFSSDAIPAHLITKEALTLYLSKLAKEGVILFIFRIDIST